MLVFLVKFVLVEVMISMIVQKIMVLDVLLNFAFQTIVFASFNLWMPRGNVDMFVLVINFLREAWVFMHVIVGLFDVNDMIGISMVVQL
jgi:type IV secretory pathway VirB6-like protein